MTKQRGAESNRTASDRQKDRQRSLPRLLAALCAAAFVLSLIPILAAAGYAHPLIDDFGFSGYVYQAVQGGGGLFEVLSASFAKVRDVYLTWQGTFSAVFLFTLQPGAFSDDLYGLTTWILLAALAGGTYFLFDTLVVRWLGARRAWSVVITFSLLLVCVQFVPDKKEAFFWYNGAMYYSFFYSLTLILFALVIRMVLAGEWRRKLAIGIAACVLSFFLGGGNYCTALLAAAVLAVVPLGAYVIRRKEARICGAGTEAEGTAVRDAGGSGGAGEDAEDISSQNAGQTGAEGTPLRECLLYAAIPACLLLALAISLIAPGNSVRGTSMEGMSAARAVLLSVYYAARYAADWTGTAQLALFLGLTPILAHLARKARFSFPYPVLMILAAFLCYAAMFTAPLYAMSYEGSGRQLNIYYYTYHLVVLFGIFYLSGWAVHRGLAAQDGSAAMSAWTRPGNLACAAAVLAALLIAGCSSYGYSSLTSLDTALALLDGTAQAYDEEYCAVIEEVKAGILWVDDIETVPDFFGGLDLATDGDGYSNLRMSEYYGVEYFYRKTDE